MICFDKFFHDYVLGKAMGNQRLACEYLSSRQCEPHCPYSKKSLPGRFASQDDRDYLDGFYVPLRCPDQESSQCFINDYMVQGIKLKILWFHIVYQCTFSFWMVPYTGCAFRYFCFAVSANVTASFLMPDLTIIYAIVYQISGTLIVIWRESPMP